MGDSIRKLIALAVCFSALIMVPAQTSAQEEDVGAPETVLVAGASGKTGRLVIAQLKDKGYGVRAMTRNIERAKENVEGDYDWVVGDVRDIDSLHVALEGVDMVISAIGFQPGDKDETNYPEFLEYGGIRNLVDASKEVGVSHFVLTSSAGVTHEDHFFNEMLHNILIWKLKGEDHLRDSGLVYTVVRPGGLRDHAVGEYGVFFDQGDKMAEGQISRADLATVLIESLGRPKAQGKTFEVFNYYARESDTWKETAWDHVTPDN